MFKSLCISVQDTFRRANPSIFFRLFFSFQPSCNVYYNTSAFFFKKKYIYVYLIFFFISFTLTLFHNGLSIVVAVTASASASGFCTSNIICNAVACSKFYHSYILLGLIESATMHAKCNFKFRNGPLS